MVRMIRVAVCDDDINIRTQMHNLLHEILDEEEELEFEVAYYADGLEIVNAAKTDQTFHIIFMDVEMKKMDGLNAAMQIRKMDWHTLIVYISNYKDYVFRSFETRPFEYLLKPIKRERFREVFQKAYREILMYQGDFILETGKKQIRLPMKEILYFESDNKKVTAHFTNHTEVFSAQLNQVENQLIHSIYPFIRVHKSYLVNYHHIRTKTPETVELSNKTIIPISRNMKDSASKRYAELVIRTKGH